MLLPLTPSVSDKIDWTQFQDINDPSGKVMYHIPYNYFHVWREQGKQEVYKEILKLLKEGKDFKKYIEERLE